MGSGRYTAVCKTVGRVNTRGAGRLLWNGSCSDARCTQPSPCSSHGRCGLFRDQPEGHGVPICTCDAGFSGHDCGSASCQHQGQWIPQPVAAHAHSGPEGLRCNCSTGWWGAQCEWRDPCASALGHALCEHAGRCVALRPSSIGGSGTARGLFGEGALCTTTCNCSGTHWVGEHCETPSTRLIVLSTASALGLLLSLGFCALRRARCRRALAMLCCPCGCTDPAALCSPLDAARCRLAWAAVSHPRIGSASTGFLLPPDLGETVGRHLLRQQNASFLSGSGAFLMTAEQRMRLQRQQQQEQLALARGVGGNNRMRRAGRPGRLTESLLPTSSLC